MVGCVIAKGAVAISEGWHRAFGLPHAEIEALRIAGEHARGATAYVTLEPCCHHGKTPPCADALIEAGVARVVVGVSDPNPEVCGGGMRRLAEAGIEVELLDDSAVQERAKCTDLIRPFVKLITTGRPWVIAKWAMTLDGKIATYTGDARWVSGIGARALVHDLRGRIDAVIVGRGTVEADDPLLTARPPGPRTATRIVVDSGARLSPSCRLIATTDEAPVMVAVAGDAPHDRCAALECLGAEVLRLEGDEAGGRLEELLNELGRRRMTNVLLEGGEQLAGGFFDRGLVDEVWVFVAGKIVGGKDAPGPIGGTGRRLMEESLNLTGGTWRQLGEDLYYRCRVGGC